MSKSSTTAGLIPFYWGQQPDTAGRFLAEVWGWDYEALECAHDYIQWLFPLDEPSAYNPDAPIVDAAAIQTFRQTPALQQRLIKSYATLLRFYGLQRQAPGVVVIRAEDYPVRAAEWVQPLDHNHLRITRILKCLTLFGLASEAQAFYTCLQEIYRENHDAISPTTFQYWTDAISPQTEPNA